MSKNDYDVVEIQCYENIPKDEKIICEFSIIYHRPSSDSNMDISRYISFYDIKRMPLYCNRIGMYKLNNNYIITTEKLEHEDY